MLIDSPNLYNEIAFGRGRKDFLDGKGLIANPYMQKIEESNYMDWRIGWRTEEWEQNIKKKDNNE